MTKPWWTRALLGRTAVSNPLQDDDGGGPQFEAQWRPQVKRRLFIILACLALWVGSLEGRLIWVQVVSHEHWATEARNQQENIEIIDAPRGSIFDRNGRLLAGSVTSYDLYVFPKNVREAKAFKDSPPAFAKQLCKALEDCEPGEEAAIALKLEKPKGTILVRKAKQMSGDAVAGVREFAKGLGRWQNLVSLEPREVRFYPNKDLAAQVIGFLDGSGAATSGIEKQFDHLLRGTPGKQIRQVDGLGWGMGILTTVIVPPKPGISIELTIDLRLQEILERELANGVDIAGALGATAVMLDSATSEVVAMGSLPTYNLNVPGTAVLKDQLDASRNRAVQDLYEPGSTFKIVTLAAALNEGIVNTTTLFDTSPRPFMIEGRPKPITEDKNHNYGTLNVQGILVHSSNIGAAMVGLRMGPDVMIRYAEAMGFSKRDTASDFFSQRFGAINVPKGGLTRASLAVVSYGYQIQASPLQIVTVMNAFANSGVLMQPRLVRATIDRDVRRIQPRQQGTQVVRPETAATMLTMLEAVVEDGTGDRAALARYRVGGKTGTTKQVGKAGYSNTDYLVSFVGIAPTRHPRFSIAVVVERPTKVPPYGGQVSAPIFKRIAEQALHYVGEPPSINAAPAVVVTEQRPGFLRPARPEPPTVFVNDDGVPTMPDLTGLTLRDALKRLPPALTLTSQGDGVVVSQSPAAGTPISGGSAILKLQRAPVKTGGSGR